MVKSHRRLRLLVPLLIGAGMLPVSVAQANETVDQGSWDSGYSTGNCANGTNTRTCTYDVNYTNCQEASVSTGIWISVLIPCDVHFHGSVTVQPRVSAANKVAGCTSVAGTGRGTVTFDSNVSAEFDRTSSPIPVVVTVESSQVDQKTAAVHFAGTTTDSSTYTWTVNGSLTATCAPSDSSVNGSGAGTVTTAVDTSQSVR